MSIEQPFDPDQHRRDAMTEGSGFSTHLADARLSDEAFPGTEEPPRSPRAPHKDRPSGHVRDFESDRDHQLAEERAAFEPSTPERQIANIKGAPLGEIAIADTVLRSIRERVEREIPLDDYDIPKCLKQRKDKETFLVGQYLEKKAAKQAERAERLAQLSRQVK